MDNPGTLNEQPQLSYINKSYCKARRLPPALDSSLRWRRQQDVGSEAPDFGISAGWTYQWAADRDCPAPSHRL